MKLLDADFENPWGDSANHFYGPKQILGLAHFEVAEAPVTNQ